eukprot:Nk52_evm35s163 gene=Nk52_evmTU35s163
MVTAESFDYQPALPYNAGYQGKSNKYSHRDSILNLTDAGLHEYMRSLVTEDVQGENSIPLRTYMGSLQCLNKVNILLKHVNDIDCYDKNTSSVLRQIAEIRNVDYQALAKEYIIYLKHVKRINNLYQKQPFTRRPPLEEYWGSTPHMKFGKVVGDALGIDPMLGAMLNPTGGFAGYSYFKDFVLYGDLATVSSGFKVPFSNNTSNAQSMCYMYYHHSFHHACGYLYNYHGLGPGYNYLNVKLQLPTSWKSSAVKQSKQFWTRLLESLCPPDTVVSQSSFSLTNVHW